MWPWGHLAVGYLLYSGLRHVRDGRSPNGVAVLVLAIGTQFPDIVDKPLAWTVALLPTGRSLAHSLFTAILVSAVVLVYARRNERSFLGVAFGVGYLSHLPADVFLSLISGEWIYTTFLLWPVLASPSYETPQSFAAHITGIQPTSFFLFQLLLSVIAVVVWVADGAPGLAEIHGAVRSRLHGA